MAGSTLAARALGRLLAQYRERAGLTRYAAAQFVDTSQQTVGRIEDGVKAKVGDLWINTWADAYKCTAPERRTLLALAHDLRTAQKSWWRGFADEIPTDFNHYLSLEDSANRLTIWATNLVPGLLQTPDYRRVLAWTENPTWTHDEVERRVQVATNRQQRLQDSKFRLIVLLSEAVLYNQVGSDAVMEEQLTQLASLSELSNITIGIVPFKATNPIGPIVSSCTLLEFPILASTKSEEPPVVYVEGYVGDLYLESEGDVKQYRDALGRIGQVALDPTQSRQRILAVAEEYRG
ncbi:helix-turn-helix domain-containing protein [Nocardia transvalensis]|uniref:helix-turn-helix domain-containing protein n=1 Tax=Nocardia transvalensis TaxID=37333 RepID=UPI0018953375|nr:helix-turn-helix transcriptional regulator [Nocardia transvalensis]MBF6332915.1 helix-turn-helix domain-containing protein [Nocardia transvalensis]